ncbi:MAG: acetylornithine deacetylase [Acidobacteriaceae bacterium]
MPVITLEGMSPAALLRELVRIPSVSHLSNRPVMEFVKSVLQPRGWHVRELPYNDAAGVEKLNLIATPPGQSADDFPVDLAFVCHTDTVPYNAAWPHAVDPEMRDGMLHGCGACDVKGFLACLLAAFASVPAAQYASTVALVFTADEEVGCLGARRLLDAGLLRARHVVVGEPTSLYPARAGKGYGLAEICVQGKEAHSAHPAQGVSAIYRAARLIARIEEFGATLGQSSPARNNRLFDPPYTTLNVGAIAGGTAKNIVPGECKFLLEWRPVPGEAAGMVPDAVRNIVEELRRADPGFLCDIEVVREQPGFATREDSLLLLRWSELSGRTAIGVPFGTEAPWMATLAEDAIVVGPGDMRTAHSDRECVPVEELELCVSHLRALVGRPLEASR